MEFAINDTAFLPDTRPSTRTGANRQHPQSRLSAPSSSLDDVGLGGDALPRHLAIVSEEVRGPVMHESQAAARKAQLDSTGLLRTGSGLVAKGEEDSWEPLKNLTDCEGAIRDFELACCVVHFRVPPTLADVLLLRPTIATSRVFREGGGAW